MGAVLFLVLCCFIPVYGFLYNLIAAIYYNVKRAVAAANADPSKAEEKDYYPVSNIVWASLFLSIILISISYLCHS